MIGRNLDKYIENHYKNNTSSLLLKGARQVGKTYAIRKYAQKHGINLIEINFYEDESARSLFKGTNNVKDILLRISAHTHQKTSLPNTMIFFDEVQKCPDVITWIKFLVDEGSCRYALSGCLLGVELKDIESVPVGYMAIKEVYPLDMEEFAKNLGMSDEVLEHVRNAFENLTPVDKVINDSLLTMVQLYLVVGGMPAAVQAYLDTNDLNVVAEKHKEIIDLYKWDISQYDRDEKLQVNEIFDLIPSELDSKNKRFILKNLNEYARFSKYENGFVWLKNAGVAIPTLNITEPVPTLKLNEQRNLLKLFQNDVGLLTYQYAPGIQLKLLQGEIKLNHGAIYENLTAQELYCHGHAGKEHELHYFNSKKLGELDFVIVQDGEVIPIEVKSGKDYNRHNALNNVLEVKNFEINKAYVLCNDNVEVIGKRIYLPIYMLMFMHKHPVPEKQVFQFSLKDLGVGR
ncbi:MAG: AAA family ATPase [Bacteroidales bacterium]|nr:AAA family ATPase [Bacteroidales bacterium]